MNESAERDRIKAIISSDGGKAMATLANHLAFETDVSVDAVTKILIAARSDVDRAVAGMAAESGGEAKSESFIEHKAGAGTLGLAGGVVSDANDDDGWKTATASANRRFESGNFT